MEPVIQPWNLGVQGVHTAGIAARRPERVAAEFEQVLMRQWLSQVRSGALEPASGTSAGYLQLVDDHLSALVARAGGIGLGTALLRHLGDARAYGADASSEVPLNGADATAVPDTKGERRP